MLMCRRTHWRGQRIVHSSTALPRYKTNEQIEREKRHHDEYEEKMQSGYRQLMIKLRGKSRMELEDYFRE